MGKVFQIRSSLKSSKYIQREMVPSAAIATSSSSSSSSWPRRKPLVFAALLLISTHLLLLIQLAPRGVLATAAIATAEDEGGGEKSQLLRTLSVCKQWLLCLIFNISTDDPPKFNTQNLLMMLSAYSISNHHNPSIGPRAPERVDRGGAE